MDAASLEAFLNPSLKDLISPFNLPGIEQAVQVIMPFVNERRKIVVYGDYDTDGVCATAILVKTLRQFGADAEGFLPNRIGEGYGLTDAAVKRLLTTYPDIALLITVDNGVNAVEETKAIKERGIAVVITDHHLPGAELPAADALVNPKVAACPGCENLCGAGVAFFLAFALTQRAKENGLYTGDSFAAPLVVMAGLATVADVMPLTQQNRILVKRALALFKCAPIGLRRLYLRVARTGVDELSARDFGFLLAPRLNATGRIASAAIAYDLLMANSVDVADRQVAVVEAKNAERKGIESDIDREVRELMGSFEGLSAIAVANDQWNSGVVGIVAARLMEAEHIPVAIYANDHGSVRAPEGYNVHDLLSACERTLVRYGGHIAAGGFSVKPGLFDEFRQLFEQACAEQHAAFGERVQHQVKCDAWLNVSDFTMDLYEDLRLLEPFGEGNPEPVFAIGAVQFAKLDTFGQDKKHLVCQFFEPKLPPAKWWNHGQTHMLRLGVEYDVYFTLNVTDWGGERRLELRVVDVVETMKNGRREV